MDETTLQTTRDERALDPSTATGAEGQPALPFDDGTDEPIAYRLTARARRTVAPDSLPPLAVVGRAHGVASAASDPAGAPPPAVAAGDGDLERPGDTRPARARALRRAGLATDDIAGQLGVDPFLIDVWAADVRAPARRSAARPTRVVRAPVDRLDDDAPAGTRAVAPVTPLAGRGPGSRGVARTVPVAGDGAVPPASQAADDERTAAALARAEATREGRERLAREPDLAAGVGLLAGLARLDDHAITVTAATPAIAAAAVRFATRHLGVALADIGVVVRLGPKVAGDLARHRWAAALEVPVPSVAHARWRGAPGDHAEEVILRIADPTAAATLAGWCDALLEPQADDLDVAF